MTDNTPFCVAVDWGTSSFRSWLLDGAGQCLAHHAGPYGIRQIADKSFADILADARHALGAGARALPVIMCGMIGSAQGWQDAGYLQKTAGISALAAAASKIKSAENIWIVPGIQSVSDDGLADVMRGEETALAGILAQYQIRDGLFCLPGTHSKWVTVRGAEITSLSSFMTGEVFDLMRRHSILSPFMEQPKDSEEEKDREGFLHGLELARGSLGLLHHLFAIRAGILTGKFAASSASALLSGLSIGTEMVHIAPMAAAQNGTVYLNAAGVMAGLYQTALTHFDIGYQLIDGEAASCAGLYEIARHIFQD
jgi:2-dehydro-3-deoxygalactonokinase